MASGNESQPHIPIFKHVRMTRDAKAEKGAQNTVTFLINDKTIIVSWRDGSAERSKIIEYNPNQINLATESLPKMFKGPPTLPEMSDILVLCDLAEVCRGYSQVKN